MAPNSASPTARPAGAPKLLEQEFAGPPGVSRPPLTKIIATVGPASSSPEVIGKLIEAGVSVFRLNFSHGATEDHEARVRTIRSVSESHGRPVAIMGDLQGPKIRLGKVESDGISVVAGSKVILKRGEFVAKPGAANQSQVFSTNYAALFDDVVPGQRLLVNDGAVRMLVIAKRPDEIECAVTSGGLISSGKGINLPDTHLKVPALGERDWHNVEWSIEHDLDFLAQSFVRRAEDIAELRQGIEKAAAKIHRGGRKVECPLHVIAKIETPAAVANIDSIIQAADGIMIARGDLGVEMDLATVPVIQKQLLAVAEAYGRPCIVATQMLESMIHSPSPTRAEANDVACAIIDGADAVMLSGETAVGEYPVVAVESMRRIALCTEEYLASQPQKPSAPQKLIESRYRTAALAHGAWQIAQDIGAKFIIAWSQQGGGARYLSQNHFAVPIIACSSDDRAARQMQLLRGVVPVRMPVPEDLAHFTRMADAYLQETRWAVQGDLCILIAGAPIGQPGATNCLAIHEIGNPKTGFAQ